MGAPDAAAFRDMEPYRKRSFRPLGVWSIGRWRLKVTGIAYEGERPGDRLVAAARRVAEERLALSADGTAHYGVGFVGIHQGRTANFVFVDWWADENELHHHVYFSPTERPDALRAMPHGGAIACAWDLHLLAFERGAWVRAVLDPPGRPDLEAYLRMRLEEDA